MQHVLNYKLLDLKTNKRFQGKISSLNNLKRAIEVIIILFIVQFWTKASKPEPLKQDTQEEK